MMYVYSTSVLYFSRETREVLWLISHFLKMMWRKKDEDEKQLIICLFPSSRAWWWSRKGQGSEPLVLSASNEAKASSTRSESLCYPLDLTSSWSRRDFCLNLNSPLSIISHFSVKFKLGVGFQKRIAALTHRFSIMFPRMETWDSGLLNDYDSCKVSLYPTDPLSLSLSLGGRNDGMSCDWEWLKTWIQDMNWRHEGINKGTSEIVFEFLFRSIPFTARKYSSLEVEKV